MSSNSPECMPCSNKFVGNFSCAQIDSRKARQRELATLDETSTSSGIAEPYARKKLKARTGGGEGTTPVTTACPEPRNRRSAEKKHTHTSSKGKARPVVVSLCQARLPIPRKEGRLAPSYTHVDAFLRKGACTQHFCSNDGVETWIATTEGRIMWRG